MVDLTNVYVSFTFIALGGLLFGYIIGVNSNVVISGQLICPTGWTGEVGTWTSIGYGQCYNLGAWDTGILSSLNLLGATFSSLICFKFADILGRKREVQIGAALYFIGASAAAASPVLWGIYVGLTVYGLGIGFAMHAAPVYIAEISPAEIRGTLVSAKEAVIVLGIFLGFFFGAVFAGYQFVGWRYMMSVAAILAVVMEIGITFVHRSPRWLALRAVRAGGLLGPEISYLNEATAALQFFRKGASSEDVDREMQSIIMDTQASTSAQAASCTETFKYPRPLTIGCGLVFLQQVTGQPAVLYFATQIFEGAGFKSSAALSSVGVGFVKLLATLFTVWRVDQYGRRQLLLWGIVLMAAALAVLSVGFFFRSCDIAGTSISQCPTESISLPRSAALATVAALMLYVSGYQVGFGPISWLMISEVFPLNVRGAALSTAAIVNFSSNIMMTLCQTALMNALTPAGLFCAYFVLSILSFVFVKFVVPETKGKTLEEIEREMTGGKRSVQSSVAMA